MVTPVPTYRETSHQLMDQARAELEAGDLRQAGEKAWGAAAQTVKAAAQQLGWEHDSHRGLFAAVKRLADMNGDPEIHALFAYPNYLHGNFYEGTFGVDEVVRYLGLSEQFIAKIEAILDSLGYNG